MSAAAPSLGSAAARKEREWKRKEAAIARRYMGRVPWEMVVWGLGNFALWLSIWPLTLAGVLPLWAAFVLSTLSITVCYLPSHEAQHSIIATEGSRLRWLNELVGHVSTIPLLLPYRIAWITHKQHHAHANDPELDPDYGNKGDTWWQAAWNGIQARQFGAGDGYKNALRRSEDPNLGKAFREATILSLSYYAVLTTLAWTGHAIEAALIWWLPRHIAMTYIQIFHHLFPRIPLFQTGPAYHEMRRMLDERGCRNDRPE
ncbi:MAG: fatty acid desaturase [Myxococcota bacterium]|nr:fatty acid desaturase [Myxococcota bacterium]